LFAIVGTGLVAYTFENTEERIKLNEKNALLRSLHALIPPEKHDNDIFHDTLQVTMPAMLGTSDLVAVYRARKNGEPVAIALTAVAPNGYSGAIKLLIGILYDGTLAGVRIVTHHETPGLGDAIEETRSDWVLSFSGKSLENPNKAGWKVKKDGGVFDQFTGATITPRAVVKAVHKALLYYNQERDKLFSFRKEPKPKPTLEKSSET
ncbi:MAG: electron transport complex subunit RsxG, partial [Gammaproteobacteria bacterium]|nr:electron transport complex subunit RsxG [Gammaproteobacteria bacterium]